MCNAKCDICNTMEFTSGRLTIGYGMDIQLLAKYLGDKAYLIVREEGKTGDNPHWQFCCMGPKKHRQALRVWMRRTYELTGNEQYSLKDATKGEHHSWHKTKTYLCKGENGEPPVVVASNGLEFDDANIIEYHEQSKKLVEELADSRCKASRMLILEEACQGQGKLEDIIPTVTKVYVDHKWPMAAGEMEAKIRLLWCINSDEGQTNTNNFLLSKFTYNEIRR